ncbi:MAG: hypothetical protein A2152_00055 [Candidatus Levybacteria bacterium RBG_16_35_6]|nr:MAG: hypothetical protein A2152_00055 [Candidatus Levybacteria bacterium RBG_16_35_6]
MLIENGNGTFTGGPLDAIMILHDVTKGTYHAAFFEEHVMPGPVPDVKDTPFVRLMSRMHHTMGSDTLEGAQKHVDELAERISLSPKNIFKNTPKEWDGQLGIVYIEPNWRAHDSTAIGKEKR